jgi:hypothetical protein
MKSSLRLTVILILVLMVALLPSIGAKPVSANQITCTECYHNCLINVYWVCRAEGYGAAYCQDRMDQCDYICDAEGCTY